MKNVEQGPLTHGHDFLAGGGEMGGLMRAMDWSQTQIGPIEDWSSSLKMIVSMLLANRFPMLLWWGPDYISIYNDAYRPVLGVKHPAGLGAPFRDVWPEVAHILGPLIDTPFNGGPSSYTDDIMLEVNRHGFAEETHFTFAYSPVPDPAAPRGIGGVLCTVQEITEKVVGERRSAVLRDLGAVAGEARTAEEACANMAAALARHPSDAPFALLYLLDETGGRARLEGAAGIEAGAPAAPVLIELDRPDAAWPLVQASQTGGLTIGGLAERFERLPEGPWSDPPHTAVVRPIKAAGAGPAAGFLVAGVSARLKLDDQHLGFFDLVAAQISAGVVNARAYEEEWNRAEALAAIDRAKTVFFSNISHEFRTPLTLMLGPLEDALADAGHPLEASQRERIALAERNGMRLQRLVNALLDFSRAEAGRIEAVFQPTELASFTRDLASSFRAACEKAGLTLSIDAPPLPEPVFVDREMWEKIVLNLISNAFKFTFEGGVAISLKVEGDAAVLRVEDTGTGIPEAALPHIFERFHRVSGAKSRTHEGTGIGLALVQELVGLHKGSISAQSRVGEGTVFTVSLPLGSRHLPKRKIETTDRPAAAGASTAAFVGEALHWLPGDLSVEAVPAEALGAHAAPGADRPSLLLADDNADMRDYLARLLRLHHDVRTVANGAEALTAIRARKPDLLLSDIMMPELDGYGLLAQIRADPALCDLPVILLSARAGEEATLEGLDAGADDYLIKPFSARELTARIAACLDRARAAQALRAREVALREANETLERRVSEALAERRLMALLIETTDTFVQVLDRDFKLLAINKANADEYERIYGFRPGVGDSLPDLLADRPSLREAVLGVWSRALAGEAFTSVDTFGDPDIDRRHYEMTFRPLHDPHGELIGAYQFSVDVTERREEQARLAEAEEQLRQSQKMEAVGQLTGGLAHDFNNLLAGISGSLEMIEARLAAGRPDGVERYIQAAQRASHRASGLTQRLLAFSRRQTLDPKPVDANRLIGGMEDLVRQSMGPDVSLEVVGEDGLWLTRADPSQLENALLNLCINARDAMAPHGGRLIIETANKGFDERAAAAYELSPGQYISVSVTDTGAGMSPEVIARAFEPFFTTKPLGQGTGLGLSMVHGFVRQSGGRVHIYSEPGRGTTVALYLPRYVGECEDIDLPATDSAANGDGRTVLVVDDEVIIRMLVVEVLEDNGYVAIEAEDGQSALGVLQSDARIDLLVTDVGLPGGLNGRQVADAGRVTRPDLKVLFITGFAENAAIGNGHLDPGMQVLAKPFVLSALAAKVRDLIEA
jgi:signal transduction histidine kinase/DNA-binding response OmpR family regulator